MTVVEKRLLFDCVYIWLDEPRSIVNLDYTKEHKIDVDT